MIKNYIKLAWRVLGRRKFFTFISLFGISFTLMVLMVAVGIADVAVSPGYPEMQLARTLFCTSMIMQGPGGDGSQWWSGPGYHFLDRYMRDIPGVERMSIYTPGDEVVAFLDGEKVTSNLRRTDGAYWEILDFEFLEGAPFTADDDRLGNHVAVISAATRRKYFGEALALGETIAANDQHFRVVGVVRDVTIDRESAWADIWVPNGTIKASERQDQLLGGFNGMFLAQRRADFARIREEFERRLQHVEFPDPEEFDQLYGRLFTRIGGTLKRYSGVDDAGQLQLVNDLPKILALVAAFLLLPVVNLISINMSRILERTSEIGVRKAFGAASHHLIGQFVVENIILCLLGGAIGLVGAVLLVEGFNTSGLVPHVEVHLNYRILFYAILVSIFFGVLSGAYPAWKMSRLQAVTALRGGTR